MSIVNAIINEVDNFAWRFVSSLKGTTLEYCDLDTTLNDHTFVTVQSELVTYIEVLGCYSLSGEEEFIAASERLELLLNGLLDKPRHSLHWVFNRSSSQTQTMIDNLTQPLKQSGQIQGLKTDIINALLEERAKTLKKYVVSESCILAFKTHHQALNNIEKAEQRELKFKDPTYQELKKSGISDRLGDFAQSLFASCERLNTIHQASLNTLIDVFNSKEVGIVVKLLDAHTAVKKLRQLQHPEQTHENFRPVLPGDPIPYTEKSYLRGLPDNEYYPSISSQIFKQNVISKGTITQVGQEYWAALTMDLPPQKPERFDKLFHALPASIDWRLSINLIGGDTYFAGKLKTRQALAKVFKVTNSMQNEPIINATQHLLDIRSEGEKLSGLRINLTIRSFSEEKVLQEINQCARILQAWGNIDTRFEHGDPWDTVVSSLPGLDSKNTGKTVIVPLKESTILLPITRPMSPWHEEGSNLWRTIDGKIFPYQSCSSLQHTWISLKYATPGGGKSVSLNSENLNLCLMPGLSRLPQIKILDIGPSSSGLIELVKALLPKDRQNEAVHKTLKNDKHSAINPFDTPLGFRFPQTSKMEYLCNFLLILFTETGQETIRPGIGELVPDLIRATYQYFSDERHPKIYTPKVEQLIDNIIESHPDWFVLEQNSTKKKLSWWFIVDKLAEQEFWKEAAIAQLHAVPLLSDLSTILHANQQLKDTHAATLKDEELFAHLNKMIRSSISQYPILAYPTQFNISEARLVALDLADVVGATDKFSLKRAGLMYMLGRQALVGDYYFSEDDLKEHYGPTRAYHEAKLNRELGEIKRICYDEFHRTAKLPPIRHQIIQDMREARKFKIEIVLVSQIDTDFDEAMVELATNIFIYRGAQGTALDRVCKTFDLNDSARHALKYQVHGASSQGASFMLKCQTKIGSFVQVLVNSMGPTELWALASTAEDALLRRRLIAVMPYWDVIHILAKKFPEGSCKKEVDSIITQTGSTMEDVIDLLVNQLSFSK